MSVLAIVRKVPLRVASLAASVFALNAVPVAAVASNVLAPPAHAAPQGNPTVTAQLSTGIVKLGADVRVVIVVENAQTASVDALPAVDGLRFGPLQGPSTEEYLSIANGRRTRSLKLSWSAAVLASRKGEFRIPPITVTVDGQKTATRELTLKVVEDLQGEELGFFEIDAPDQVAEGQPFTLDLRFGWDAAIEQQLNYANLSLPWLGELPGVVELDAQPLPQNAAVVELNLNSRDRIRAERLPDRQEKGRTFHLLHVKKRYLASRPGKIEIPTSHLEFGQVEDNGGFFGIRPTREKQTYYKRFPGFTIDVITLPTAGRPFDFGGAVGKINANATCDRRDVDVGDSIKLSIEWTGDANLEFFEPPDLARLDSFKSFRVYGTNDKKSYERRTVIYDIAPIVPDVGEIPAVPLVVYDPTRKAYVTVSTQPIPIHVRPLKDASGLTAENARPTAVLDIHDIQAGSEATAGSMRSRGWLPWSALGTVFFGWIALRAAVRRRGDPDAPRTRARRLARKTLARELATARAASEQTRALDRFLAARSGESPEAWLGRDVYEWSGAVAVTRLGLDDARALSELRTKLDERAWAGTDQPLGASEVLAVADRVVKGGL